MNGADKNSADANLRKKMYEYC